MELCLGVVLYYPSQENINNILLYSKFISKIYIYDNTEEPDSKIAEAFSNEKFYHYMPQKSNMGMAKALNDLCNNAIKDGFDYIITMDQDSVFENSSLNILMEFISNNDLTDVGIVAPKIIFLNWKSNKSKTNSMASLGTNLSNNVKWVITSGSAINLKSYSYTSGFDENYFIDRLDYDYCMQLNSLGLKIVVLNNSYLNQSLGEGTRNLFGFQYSEHNALRNYYIFRNRLYYSDKYLKGLRRFSFRFLGSLKQIIFIIFFDKNKGPKIKIINKAYQDYTQGRMNKYNSIR
ncbi:glycosyltransferase [Paenibacillus sonchi]|uniref:Glycosyltransferase n=1 Tax=Paenibacillus sonchi TaxID=373687 RepID=A0A974PD09_9BACL|nr:glycosyltransferase [Paenibacillus sonchi]QQZ61619.1 glycosyltransferase [Paenibacillus sonchi]